MSPKDNQNDDGVEDGLKGTTSAIGDTVVVPNKSDDAAVATSKTDNNNRNDLVWSDVNMKLLKKHGEVKLNILNGVWGKAEAGKTTAIMGASGAGKTSLFQTLAGRVPTTTTNMVPNCCSSGSNSNNIAVSGDIYLGPKKFDPQQNEDHRKLIAYVSQEDSLHEVSTPREALAFSARLRLSKSISKKDIDTLVQQTLNELGLEHVADTIIGGPSSQKGISGGEKRRVSIGIELVASPSLILLDEPTSGLDSYAANQVMNLLSKVAHNGNNIVLFTIHQPSSKIFNSFDNLILLSKGQVMHQGPISSLGIDFDANYGHPLPSNYNPADWILDVAHENSHEDLIASSFFQKEPNDFKLRSLSSKWHDNESSSSSSSNNRLCQLESGMEYSMSEDDTEIKKQSRKESRVVGRHQIEKPIPKYKEQPILDGSSSMSPSSSVSVWVEFKLLQQRESRNLSRNPTPMILNIVITSILSVIFGVIFLDVGRQDRSEFSVVQSQLGAIVNLLISTLMGQSNPAMLTFSKDRPVFLREYSSGHYTIVPYFLSKLWSEALNTLVATIIQAVIVYWMMGFHMGFGQFVAITYSLALTATAVAVMLGAFFNDINNALSLFTLVVVPQFYFSGLFIAIELIPDWVAWAQYLCSLTYASRIGFAYEFSNCGDNGDGDYDEVAASNCDSVLAANNINPDDTWWYWLALLGLFVLFRVGGIVLLRYKARY